ncbi:serine hydrolase domain-containing protein [Teredinibacter turnerae]|uniref:serine hydrolase domain-containing protein n=1 Tax=Teredinibacter turnerae TaxID=2426 RepID=UPI0004081FFB|nr:serine hydrolase domain-containing protein [Teredinibacter turnerae]
MKNLTLLLAPIVLLTACGGQGQMTQAPALTSLAETSTSAECSRLSLESAIDSTLQSIVTDVNDFSFYVEDINGDSYEFNRGNSTLQTPYESASTSKWVTAAVIMQLVDSGLLSLTDTPNTFLSQDEWPMPARDPLSGLTLAQLLSFTSGLNRTPICTNAPNSEFFACINNIARNNRLFNSTPGAEFYYGSSHLQVAGAMAIKALGGEDADYGWSDVFANFKSLTGLFPTSAYNLPSVENPRLAGGMTWTGEEYINFIRAFRDLDFYTSPAIVDQMTSDQLNGAVVANSPALDGIGEDWHYGFGMWVECHQSIFSDACLPTEQVSSPGAYGAYPFLNIAEGYFGLVARQGELGTFSEGYAIYDAIRDDVEAWAACPN